MPDRPIIIRQSSHDLCQTLCRQTSNKICAEHANFWDDRLVPTHLQGLRFHDSAGRKRGRRYGAFRLPMTQNAEAGLIDQANQVADIVAHLSAALDLIDIALPHSIIGARCHELMVLMESELGPDGKLSRDQAS